MNQGVGSLQVVRSLSVTILVALFFTCRKQSEETGGREANLNQPPVRSAFYPTGVLDSLHLDTLDHYLNQIDHLDCERVESELEQVYVRDQQYRDSLHIGTVTKNARRYFGSRMIDNDQINTKIVWRILENVGWTDTCRMSNQANMGIWYTLFHSHDKEVKRKALKCVERAF